MKIISLCLGVIYSASLYTSDFSDEELPYAFKKHQFSPSWSIESKVFEGEHKNIHSDSDIQGWHTVTPKGIEIALQAKDFLPLKKTTTVRGFFLEGKVKTINCFYNPQINILYIKVGNTLLKHCCKQSPNWTNVNWYIDRNDFLRLTIGLT